MRWVGGSLSKSLSSYRHHEGQHHKDEAEPDLHLWEGGVVRLPLRERKEREN